MPHPGSLVLSPRPLPIHMHPSTFNKLYTDMPPFFQSTKFYWNARANRKVWRWDLDWDNVGTFLKVAGSEFRTDGTMQLKEPSSISWCNVRMAGGSFSHRILELRHVSLCLQAAHFTCSLSSYLCGFYTTAHGLNFSQITTEIARIEQLKRNVLTYTTIHKKCKNTSAFDTYSSSGVRRERECNKNRRRK